jgi:hypothetical protein
VPLGSDFNARVGAVESARGTVKVGGRIVRLQPLSCSFARLFCARYIDFAGGLCRLRQDCDSIRQHLCETPRHGEVVIYAILTVRDLANRQFGNKRSMPGQDPKATRFTGHLRLIGYGVHNQFLWRDDFELEGIRHKAPMN